MLVRSWNLFHGNTSPPSSAVYLEEMVRLACADRPDVLVLQEVPAWALHERSVAADRAAEAESQALAARSLRVQGLDPKQSLVLASRAEGKQSTPQAAPLTEKRP